jgi:hypothetical protein
LNVKAVQVYPTNPVAPEIIATNYQPTAVIFEWPFRAGAAIAAKLIWENPDLYTNGKQVADAAWEWAQPRINAMQVTNNTNKPN